MSDKLYIIGNGFDLHHQLNTSYFSFRDYISKKNNGLWRLLYNLYGDAIDSDMWWNQFEEMLGRINYYNLVHSQNGEALGSIKAENLLKNQLPPLFGQWIKDSINLNVVEPDHALMIDQNSLFFTFNYTLTLESVYHVPDCNIWHIHKSIKEPDSIVIGHDSDRRRLFIEYLRLNCEQTQIRPDIVNNIIQSLAKGAKDVNGRINKNHDSFYEKYSSIKQVAIMGFSFNDIDMPYLETIIKANSRIDDVRWTLYYYKDGEEKCQIEKLIQLGIRRNNIKIPIHW